MNLSINNNNSNKSLEEEEEEEEDEDQDNNKNIKQTFDENDRSNYRNEIIEMPFLIPGVKISNWLRNHRVRLLSLIMSILTFFSLIVHFFVIYIGISNKIDEVKEKGENGEYSEEIKCKKISKILTLEDYLTNELINFIFRIDIEIIVFLYHSLLFICYFKGKNFINNFFCHIFWAMFNKSYFSYILVANPIILFIFYQSETKILLNLYNLILYSLISGSLIFLSASFSYIFFELPYKKIIRMICSNDSKNDELEENENEKEEEENKSEDEDD
jgi:hypothetical protein